jgi:hypothetical protein
VSNKTKKKSGINEKAVAETNESEKKKTVKTPAWDSMETETLCMNKTKTPNQKTSTSRNKCSENTKKPMPKGPKRSHTPNYQRKSSGKR